MRIQITLEEIISISELVALFILFMLLADLPQEAI